VKRGVLFVSFVLGAVLAGAIEFAVQPTPHDSRLRSVQPAGATPSDFHAPARTAADRLRRWVADSLARPLFVPDRRPSPQASAIADTVGGWPRLSGIMVTSGDRRAIFAGPSGGKPDVVAEGTKLGRYLVQSISVGEVVLIGPDGRHSLRPTFDGNAPGPATRAPIFPRQGVLNGTRP
jgi:hypothetical protein